MISPETRVQIRRYFYTEHWKIGTIAQPICTGKQTSERERSLDRGRALWLGAKGWCNFYSASTGLTSFRHSQSGDPRCSSGRGGEFGGAADRLDPPVAR
jgi:hypothetical protein